MRSEVIRPINEANAALINGAPIREKSDPRFGDAAYQTAFRMLAQLKTEGFQIELCCTGGLHVLRLIVHSAATLLFGAQDRLWNLDSPKHFVDRAGDGALMHASPDDGVRVEQLRFVAVGQLFVNLRSAALMSPDDIVARSYNRVRAINMLACEQVLSQLTPAQKSVLRVFANGALTVKDAAAQLQIGVNTVNSHKKIIYSLCRSHFELEKDAAPHFSFLRDQFGQLPEGLWQSIPAN